MPLHVVPPAPPPEEDGRKKAAKRITAPRPAEMLECPRCKGREVVPSVIGLMLINGRPRGGTKQYLCVTCLLKGERVVIY